MTAEVHRPRQITGEQHNHAQSQDQRKKQVQASQIHSNPGLVVASAHTKNTHAHKENTNQYVNMALQFVHTDTLIIYPVFKSVIYICKCKLHFEYIKTR